MIPYNYTEFINDLIYLVKNNFVSMDRIDDAVERILLVKFNLGLFENPLADFSMVNEVGSQVDLQFPSRNQVISRLSLCVFYKLIAIPYPECPTLDINDSLFNQSCAYNHCQK